MVTFSRHKNHSISWVDLAASDLSEALAFYEGLFGWTAMTDDESDYAILLCGGEPVAGAMGMSPEMGSMPPVWSVYVSVEDADACLAKAAELGGQTMQQPFDIPGDSRIAVLADPAGAALCLFEGGAESGFKLMDEPGAPCWFDCHSRDADAADRFYSELFGWSSTPMEGFPYRVMDLGGEALCGIMAMGDDVPPQVPSHWIVNFSVADADEAATYTEAKGGQIVMPPSDTPYGRACRLADPWGAGFMVIDRSTATED